MHPANWAREFGVPDSEFTPSVDVISDAGNNVHGSPTSGVGTNVGEFDALADAEFGDEPGDAVGEDATLLDVVGDGAADGVRAPDAVDGCVTPVLAVCCLPDEQPASTPNSTTPTTERFTTTARSLPADVPTAGLHTP